MVFLMLLALGCETQPEPVKPVVVEVTPESVTKSKVELPSYDETLDTTEERAAWQAEVMAQIDAYAAVADPETVRAKYLPYFKLTTKIQKQPLGDAHVWDAPPKRTRADAVVFEAKGEEYAAGRIYAAYGDKEAVRRCIRELREELEWAAVHKLEYLIGDLPDGSEPQGVGWTINPNDVLLYSQIDRPRALELAREVEPSFWSAGILDVSDGEGCGAWPVAGPLELYKVLSADPDLKAAYLKAIASLDVSYRVTDCNLQNLGALLTKVRTLKDAELTRAWDEALGFDAGYMYEEYVGVINGYRVILGVPPIAPSNLDPFVDGILSATDAKKLALQLKMDVKTTPEQVRAEIITRVEDAMMEKDAVGKILSSRMFVAKNAWWTNGDADEVRIKTGAEPPRHVYPCTDAEFVELMTPVRAQLASKGIPNFEPYVTTGP